MQEFVIEYVVLPIPGRNVTTKKQRGIALFAAFKRVYRGLSRHYPDLGIVVKEGCPFGSPLIMRTGPT